MLDVHGMPASGIAVSKCCIRHLLQSDFSIAFIATANVVSVPGFMLGTGDELQGCELLRKSRWRFEERWWQAQVGGKCTSECYQGTDIYHFSQ